MNELVVAAARAWIGTPYHHQAALKHVGCDCLGLVRGIYAELIGPAEAPPPYSPDWAETKGRGEEAMLDAARRYLVEVPWKRGDQLQPGQVLVFRYRPTSAAKHAGIVVEPEKMVHSYNRVGVTEVSLGHHWTSKIAGVFLFPGA